MGKLTATIGIPTVLLLGLRISAEVLDAQAQGRPIVALESAVITHGMPYPHNLKLAQSLEEIILRKDCTPATIAVFRGKPCVGLTADQMQQLAQDTTTVKISKRDIGVAAAKNLSGGTTVAATLFLAAQAGIQVFATGGLGGVHQGVAESWDISADLKELSRSSLIVVCAGVKSLLDIPKTLEYLETESVLVVSFGSDEFPGFFSASSGVKSPYNVSTVEEMASIFCAQTGIGNESGIVMAVPPPKTDGSIAIQNAIQEAIAMAKMKGIRGKDVTPFVLKQVHDNTSGLSLDANIALLKQNAEVAADVALALNKNPYGIAKHSPAKTNCTNHDRQPKANCGSSGTPYDVVIVGGTNLDMYLQLATKDFQMDGSTYSGSVSQGVGGVGRNMADALTRLGHPTLLISALGSDYASDAVRLKCQHMDLSGVSTLKSGTGVYAGILNADSNVLLGIMDSDIHEELDSSQVRQHEARIAQSKLAAVDANVSVEIIKTVATICKNYKIPFWFEPTNKSTVTKVLKAQAWKEVKYTSPNWKEFTVLANDFLHTNLKDEPTDLRNFIRDNKALLFDFMADHLDLLLITCGVNGSLALYRSDEKINALYMNAPNGTIVNSSGAGDCMNAGIISGLVQQKNMEECLRMGSWAASCSLRCNEPVPNTFEQLPPNSSTSFVNVVLG